MAHPRALMLPRLAIVFVLLPLGAGCATSTAVGNRYEVSASSAQFFKYGPAQSYGPDFTIAKGQRLTMVHREFGFSQVRLDDGQTGSIPTEQLKAAPPEPKARPAAKPIARSRS